MRVVPDAAASYTAEVTDELVNILDGNWTELARGSASAKHAFHLPVLGTVDEQGGPALRTVVLRRVDAAHRMICCHTDRRSPKVAQLQSSPQVAWLFYDIQSRIQVRVRGRGRVHFGAEDPVARETWRQVAPRSRVCYWAPHPPSTVVAAGESNYPAEAPDIAAGRIGSSDDPPASFAVVATVVESLDWLELHHDGHRRAHFGYGVDGEVSGQWLAP